MAKSIKLVNPNCMVSHVMYCEYYRMIILFIPISLTHNHILTQPWAYRTIVAAMTGNGSYSTRKNIDKGTINLLPLFDGRKGLWTSTATRSDNWGTWSRTIRVRYFICGGTLRDNMNLVYERTQLSTCLLMPSHQYLQQDEIKLVNTKMTTRGSIIHNC